MDPNLAIAIENINLAKITGEKKVNLSGLGLNEIPKELFLLEDLRELYLDNNNIIDIPYEITKFDKLGKLSINRNKLKIIPDFISELSALWSLSLAYNEIEYITESISNLRRLAILDLRYNRILYIPENIGNLEMLLILNLKNNNIDKIPSSVSKFKRIKTLNLSQNHIETIPIELCYLESLEGLSLSGNKLKSLPYEICKLKGLYPLKINKERLVLKGNPLISPPIEVAEKGLYAIEDYFLTLNSATEINYLYEAKLILVGEGEVGKTSLSKTITNPYYELDREDRTEGIDIIDWKLSIDKFENTNYINLHVWDFGGQEIYHSTHQFFLTTRSIYLFVLNPRREENINTYYYWLNIIKLLGGNSPVIVVVNKSDLYQREFTLDEFQTFNDKVIGVIKTSCETRFGIEELKEEIKNCLGNLEHLGTPFDKRWLDVRRELQKLNIEEQRDIINLVEYESICQKYNLNDSDIKRLSDIFHTLGIFIHYQDDIRLQNIIILNPEWATQGVYKILDNERVRNNNGLFSDLDLDSIWYEDKFRYHKAELLALMKKFELCFELKNGSDYIAPQLLSKQVINYQWDNRNNVYFEYSYQFMPKGIISHFIVKQNEDILKDQYWLNGVLVEWNNTRALVTEHYIDKKINIVLEGKDKKHFLAIIRKSFFGIHNRFQNLNVTESIGCICNDCSKSESPYLYSIETLKNAQKKKIKELQCQKSFESVNLDSLVNLIEEGKPEDGLQGTFFESIVKSLLQSLFPDASIRQSVIIDGFEFDFIVISHSLSEIIVVEAKGYKSTQKIKLGEFDKSKNKYEKGTVNWFFRQSFPKAKSKLSVLSDNPLFNNHQVKACYIASCAFTDDAIHTLKQMNQGSLKSKQLEIYYDRYSLISILQKRGLKQQLLELNRYYL